jgi:hypothetical protein
MADVQRRNGRGPTNDHPQHGRRKGGGRKGAGTDLGWMVVLGATARQDTRGRSIPEGDEGGRVMKWPLMWVSNHRKVELENYTLRDALREANKELLKHRLLITGLRTGQEQTTRQFEKALKGGA